jgi:hypothetical protein
VAACVGAILAVCSGSAFAQSADPGTGADERRIEFLSRFAFHLGAQHLSGDDRRYVWDVDYGGEVDLVDYVVGRATFYANYQAVLGEEFHAFDPNQGNYILGARASARVHGWEAAFVFHHVSRHLSDRFKRVPVDWNMVGVRLVRSIEVPGARLEGRVDARGVILKSFVDYDWEVDAGVRGRYPLASRVALVSDLGVTRIWVDGSGNRGAQHGVRGELGLRLDGSAAAVELFVAGERRIDAHPLVFGAQRWFTAGFRLVNR